jgi:ribosomal protein S12 methylthiotransferase accessory factor
VDAWADSRFTGPFTALDSMPLRPHDPAIPMCGGTFPSWTEQAEEGRSSGAGWTEREAKLACIGEAIERLQPAPLSQDRFIESSFADWPLDEPALGPDRWVMFHPDQYRWGGFPFERFTPATVCRWYACRDAVSGMPAWVPEEMIFLHPQRGERHRLCAAITTGLSAGPSDFPVLLRGLQEVIERDAMVSAWWGRYAIEEWAAEAVFAQLGSSIARRLQRPNLRYRFYRMRTPFSDHVTLARLDGEDREGFCFSIGSACRETRDASWRKSVLEAVQGRHYVRHLKTQPETTSYPASFADHAVFYSRNPALLERTVLEQLAPPTHDAAGEIESLTELCCRLGPDRPVLFRNLTPPGIAQEFPGWLVLRVIVPGMQPLHGNHMMPHLGGPLWASRPADDWRTMLPHPFP